MTHYIRKLDNLTESDLEQIGENDSILYIFHKKNSMIPISLYHPLTKISNIEFKQVDTRDDMLISIGMILAKHDKDTVFNTDPDIKLPDYVKTVAVKKIKTQRTPRKKKEKNTESTSKSTEETSDKETFPINPPVAEEVKPDTPFEEGKDAKIKETTEAITTKKRARGKEKKNQLQPVRDSDIELMLHYISVKFDEAGYSDKKDFVQEIGYAMQIADRNEDRLREELKNSFKDDAIIKKIIESIHEKPLIWSFVGL